MDDATALLERLREGQLTSEVSWSSSHSASRFMTAH